MELWVVATLAAALAQSFRFALQKRLKEAGLSATGATLARFLYSAPLLALALTAFVAATGTKVPDLTVRFWVFALAGGLGQILATVCVVAMFSLRNFAIGLTFKKSEVMQTVFVGWLILGEGISGAGFGALALGLVALLVLSAQDGPIRLTDVRGNRAVLLGVGSGAFFALAGVCYRGATLELDTETVALRAAFALSIVTLMQVAMMVGWLAWRDRAELSRVTSAWRPGIAVGLTSLAGSLCWFVAFAEQTAAYVYALGQVELVFASILGLVMFGERLSKREVLGLGLLLISIVILVLVV